MPTFFGSKVLTFTVGKMLLFNASGQLLLLQTIFNTIFASIFCTAKVPSFFISTYHFVCDVWQAWNIANISIFLSIRALLIHLGLRWNLKPSLNGFYVLKDFLFHSLVLDSEKLVSIIFFWYWLDCTSDISCFKLCDNVTC